MKSIARGFVFTAMLAPMIVGAVCGIAYVGWTAGVDLAHNITSELF